MANFRKSIAYFYSKWKINPLMFSQTARNICNVNNSCSEVFLNNKIKELIIKYKYLEKSNVNKYVIAINNSAKGIKILINEILNDNKEEDCEIIIILNKISYYTMEKEIKTTANPKTGFYFFSAGRQVKETMKYKKDFKKLANQDNIIFVSTENKMAGKQFGEYVFDNFKYVSENNIYFLEGFLAEIDREKKAKEIEIEKNLEIKKETGSKKDVAFFINCKDINNGLYRCIKSIKYSCRGFSYTINVILNGVIPTVSIIKDNSINCIVKKNDHCADVWNNVFITPDINKHRYIVLLDSDCEFLEDGLTKMISQMKEDNLGVCGCNLINHQENNRVNHEINIAKVEKFVYNKVIGIDTKLIKDGFRYDERFLECCYDLDFIIRANIKTKIGLCDECKCLFGINVNPLVYNQRQIKKDLKLFRGAYGFTPIIKTGNIITYEGCTTP